MKVGLGGGGFWDDWGQLKPSVWASDYFKSLPLAPPPLLNANLQDGQAPGVLRAGPAQRLPQKQAGEVGEVYSAPSLSLGPLTQGMEGEGPFKPWLCCFLLRDPEQVPSHLAALRSESAKVTDIESWYE